MYDVFPQQMLYISGWNMFARLIVGFAVDPLSYENVATVTLHKAQIAWLEFLVAVWACLVNGGRTDLAVSMHAFLLYFLTLVVNESLYNRWDQYEISLKYELWVVLSLSPWSQCQCAVGKGTGIEWQQWADSFNDSKFTSQMHIQELCVSREINHFFDWF